MTPADEVRQLAAWLLANLPEASVYRARGACRGTATPLQREKIERLARAAERLQ